MTVANDPDHVDLPQLWEVIVERVRSEILSGVSASGTRLIETELAARFGTSRGPVRDALRELVRQGLAVEVPRRGTVVSTMSARDLSEVYGVREAIEIGACRVVIQRASDAALEGLRVLVVVIEERRGQREAADYLTVSEADFAFHRHFVGLTANGRLVAAYESMLTQSALLLRTASTANPVLRTGFDRPVHTDIINALSARDATRAEAAVENHYRYAEERLFPELTRH